MMHTGNPRITSDEALSGFISTGIQVFVYNLLQLSHKTVPLNMIKTQLNVIHFRCNCIMSSRN